MLDFVLIRNDHTKLLERWIFGNNSALCYDHVGKHIMNIASDGTKLIYTPDDNRYRYNKNTRQYDEAEFSLATFNKKFNDPTIIPTEQELEEIKLKYIMEAEKLANSPAKQISSAEAQSYSLSSKIVGFIAKTAVRQDPDPLDPAYIKCSINGVVLYKRDKTTNEALIISYYLPAHNKLSNLAKTTYYAKLPDAEANMTFDLKQGYYEVVCQQYLDDGNVSEFIKKFNTFKDAKKFFQDNKHCSSVNFVADNKRVPVEDLQRIHVTPLSYTDKVAEKVVELDPRLSKADAGFLISALGVSKIDEYISTNIQKFREIIDLYLEALNDPTFDTANLADLKQLLTENFADSRDVFYVLKYNNLD